MTRATTVLQWALVILPVLIIIALIVCVLFALTIPTPDQQLPTL